MIVNPQLLNYRLIIGSLIIAVAVLTVYSFTSYKSIATHQQFLEQEKKLVESELSQMIASYDDVSISNNLISSQLEDAKRATKLTLDSLRILRSDLSVLSKFKQQLFNLKLKNKTLFKTVDSLNEVNKDLEREKLLANSELIKQQLENSTLVQKNKNLNKTLEKGALLTANSFKAKGFETFFGNKRFSSKAKRVETIEVCFILAENSLTEAGAKDFYIQIVNPKNNVVADKGSINFGESTLIYSAKEIVNYNNNVVEVCIDVDADINEKPLEQGNYYISIFHKDRKLGSTQVNLN
ncbi:hypothetical protein ES692_15090 [Psychroserpens burtonensis]|uniref:Chromosome partitioning protein ParA n=1 Tax=Psychroserpens burtonensis TaxID=49278 RepID=A0A5C7B7L3_9FLAO|nr:hypothetical protein [Psychroserpens burtonensis]TXE15818.1 hypothetical protein ES692_15090 [Psychroserpens burtonensis]